MIFITLGSQKFQFNRILEEIDSLICKGIINEKVFAQIGYSTYLPRYFDYEQFLDREQFNNILDESRIVITHGGTGAILTALKKRKKVIAVPRRKEYQEHVDNHQTQIVKQFYESNLIEAADSMYDLEDKLVIIENKEYREFTSTTHKVVNSILNYIESI